MTHRFANTTRLTKLGLGAVLAGLLLPGLGLTMAQASEESQGRKLEGAWVVSVSLVDCVTGAEFGSFNSLVTFARGGTIIESSGSLAFAPGQRSLGHGTWTHLGGREYQQKVIALMLFETPPNPPASPGFEAGWATIDHLVTLGSDPNQFTSAGFGDFFDLDGELYRHGCSTATGVRFE